jgi:hypothetical protein
VANTTIITLETYIRSWLNSLTGLNTIWIPQNCPEPTRPYITFYLYNEKCMGQDFTAEENLGLTATLYGERKFKIRIACYCNCRPMPTGVTFVDPREVLRKVRASIYNESTIAFFRTYNLVLNDDEIAEINDTTFQNEEDGHWIHAAETEVMLTAQYEETLTQYEIRIVNIDGNIEPSDLEFESEITL